MSTYFLNWTQEEWLTAHRWAQEQGKEYPPTLDGGAQLQSDYCTAHAPPATPESTWFNQFRRSIRQL